MAAFSCNLTNAGPSIAIIQTAMEFQVVPTKAAYLFSAPAFAQGLASFLWAPLVSILAVETDYSHMLTPLPPPSSDCQAWKASHICLVVHPLHCHQLRRWCLQDVQLTAGTENLGEFFKLSLILLPRF
jgi:hypothetical protein